MTKKIAKFLMLALMSAGLTLSFKSAAWAEQAGCVQDGNCTQSDQCASDGGCCGAEGVGSACACGTC